MLKLFNDTAKAMFATAVASRFPAYKLRKSLRGPIPGTANFVRDAGPGRAGWLCFGGFKDRDFVVAAAWTISGRALADLDEWEQYGNPRAFEVPPVPADGHVDLRDRWRFEGTEKGAFHSLDIGTPDPALVTAIFEAYLASDLFEADVDRLHQGALRLQPRNPPSRDTVRQEHLVVERAYCRQWAHLATRHAFSPQELEAILRPVVDKALELFAQHGEPLIERQLGQAG